VGDALYTIDQMNRPVHFTAEEIERRRILSKSVNRKERLYTYQSKHDYLVSGKNNNQTDRKEMGKGQRSKYFHAENNTNVLKYINREGLAVMIERKFGGGYIKTIGTSFNSRGLIETVLGYKRRNVYFKHSFGAKNVYTDKERKQINKAREANKKAIPSNLLIQNTGAVGKKSIIS
jgi:hypothetical protein